jgi:hypothetical protein
MLPDNNGRRLAELVDPESICRSADLPAMAARFPAYASGLAWLRDFIMQPHADLKRPGALCPFVAQGMAQDAMVFAVRHNTSGGAREAFDIMAPMADVFRGLEPVSGPAVAVKALTIFFPDLPDADMTDFIDGGHRLLKPFMVERGLMIGEFHPLSTTPGATNPQFHPMRAPVPAFVLREMAMHDTKFINFANEEPERRAMYLRSYLQRVAPGVPRKVREQAERMLADVEREISARG